MLNTFVIPQLQQRNCLPQTIFMQDCTPSHTGVKVKGQYFTRDTIISRYFSVECPPHSTDLTLSDFWFWSYLKSKVCVAGVSNLSILKNYISQTVRNIPCDMLRTGFENAVHKMNGLTSENGAHVECDLIPGKWM